MTWLLVVTGTYLKDLSYSAVTQAGYAAGHFCARYSTKGTVFTVLLLPFNSTLVHFKPSRPSLHTSPHLTDVVHFALP